MHYFWQLIRVSEPGSLIEAARDPIPTGISRGPFVHYQLRHLLARGSASLSNELSSESCATILRLHSQSFTAALYLKYSQQGMSCRPACDTIRR